MKQILVGDGGQYSPPRLPLLAWDAGPRVTAYRALVERTI